jgi:hypothetical protein
LTSLAVSAAHRNIFNEVAERLAKCPIADLLRHFGARTDINLEAFGWDLMEGEAGLDDVPT